MMQAGPAGAGDIARHPRWGATDLSLAPANAAPAGDYDLAVIGGGVNGCGIARDAAGRGLSVLLLESDDLGGATSSASTKLIHGGLRAAPLLSVFGGKITTYRRLAEAALTRLAPAFPGSPPPSRGLGRPGPRIPRCPAATSPGTAPPLSRPISRAATHSLMRRPSPGW